MSLVLVFGAPLLALSVAWFVLSKRNDIHKRLQRIDALSNEGTHDKALSMLNALPESQKALPENQMRFYRVLFAQKNYYLCLYHLNEIWKRAQYTEAIKPKDVQMSMAEVYERMEKYKKSMEVLGEILQSDADDPTANQKMGWLLYRMKNYAGALQYLGRAYGLASASGEDFADDLLYALADSHHHEKNYKEALALLEPKGSGEEKEEAFVFLAALCELSLGEVAPALNRLEDLEPSPAFRDDVLALKGLCLYKLGSKERAAEPLQAALGRRRKDLWDFVVEARYCYAMLCLGARNYKEAHQQLMFIQAKGKPYKDVQRRLEALAPLVRDYRRLLHLHSQKDLESMRSAFELVFKERTNLRLLQSLVSDDRIGVAFFREHSTSKAPSQKAVALGFAFDLEVDVEQVVAVLGPLLNSNTERLYVYGYSEGLVVEGAKTLDSLGEVACVQLGCKAMEAFAQGEPLPNPEQR